jgi:predicted transcriptional regulator
MYHLYIIQAVERGLEDVVQGRVIPHDELAETLWSSWGLRP